MIEDFIREYTSKVAEEIDNQMYKFLEENGYILERGNVKQILDLKEKLAKEDKQVRAESAIVGTKLEGEHIETKEKDDNNWVDYELLIEPIRIKEILDKENK